MSFLKKYGATLLAIGTTILTAFTPALQGLVAAHPTVATILGAAYAILAHFLPSPVQSK